METVTFRWWPWRLLRALGRNPLVRTSDRIEAFVVGMAITAALVAIPIAAAMASEIHDERAREYTALAAQQIPVTATVTQAGPPLPRANVSVIEARWDFAGTERVGRFQWQGVTQPGQDIEILVNQNGERVTPLNPAWRAGVDATLAALTFWASVVAVAVAGVALSRPILQRMRYAAWDREIASLADGGGHTNRTP
ncbi:Rv1733c family protein [Mycolicibacterium phlei]|jgi:hypothetical protein